MDKVMDQPELAESLTMDRFLGGSLSVTQPRDGFRAGSDAVDHAEFMTPVGRRQIERGLELIEGLFDPQSAKIDLGHPSQRELRRRRSDGLDGRLGGGVLEGCLRQAR